MLSWGVVAARSVEALSCFSRGRGAEALWWQRGRPTDEEDEVADEGGEVAYREGDVCCDGSSGEGAATDAERPVRTTGMSAAQLSFAAGQGTQHAGTSPQPQDNTSEPKPAVGETHKGSAWAKLRQQMATQGTIGGAKPQATLKESEPVTRL